MSGIRHYDYREIFDLIIMTVSPGIQLLYFCELHLIGPIAMGHILSHGHHRSTDSLQ